MGRAMTTRIRSRPHSFEDRLAAEATRLRGQARKLSPGEARDAILKKISQIETASQINNLLKSPDASR